MRELGLLLLVFAAVACAQTADDASVSMARAELAHVESLVEAGTLPPASLDKARALVADVQDAAILRHIAAVGADLNVEQADQMVAAANRRVERRNKAFDDARQLVDLGAAPRAPLQTLAEDLEQEKRQAALLETRAQLIHEIADMASAEASVMGHGEPAEGDTSYKTFRRVDAAFRLRFGKPMPVSAMGETAVHREMGFDHRGRVDVAINPDQPEGEWLVEYLKDNRIPYFAFRGPVPGKATGAHIHIGPASTRYVPGG